MVFVGWGIASGGGFTAEVLVKFIERVLSGAGVAWKKGLAGRAPLQPASLCFTRTPRIGDKLLVPGRRGNPRRSCLVVQFAQPNNTALAILRFQCGGR